MSPARLRLANSSTPSCCAASCGGTSRRSRARSSGTGGRSRSSSATRSWPSSACLWCTKTTRSAGFGRPHSSAKLATIVGTPGMGKSRLARELLRSLEGEASILVGRCSSYGEGVSYVPLADVGRDAGDISHLLADVEHGDVAARLVRGAVGAREGGGSPDETAWAFRRLFETLAATRPLVVVVDDIHWADPPLLDLIEYVAVTSRGAGIFVLCTARPDLFDLRPSWATPRPGTTLVALEALADDEAEELVDALADALQPAMHERVLATAEGNPLFVEQLLA